MDRQARRPLSRAFIWLLVAGVLISIVNFGIRSALGHFQLPMSRTIDISATTFGFVLAVQNLIWGLAQPVAGRLADRYGAAWVMAAGGAIYALGLLGLGLSSGPVWFMLSAGILCGLGIAFASFNLVISVYGRVLPPEHRGWAMGLGTAAGSLGQFFFNPIVQPLIGGLGWQTTAFILAVAALPMVLLAFAFPRSGQAQASEVASDRRPLGEILREAFANRQYLLLIAGFFVCGFQLGFITIHMPRFLSEELAMPDYLSAWFLALVGAFNIIGAYTAGTLTGRVHRSRLLGVIYLGRSLMITAFLLLPASQSSVLLLGAGLGLLWLSTVPPTNSLVSHIFGTANLAMLFGFVFLSHQIGSFIAVWMGGLLFDLSGSYRILWWTIVALGVYAWLVHLPIHDKGRRLWSPQPAA